MGIEPTILKDFRKFAFKIPKHRYDLRVWLTVNKWMWIAIASFCWMVIFLSLPKSVPLILKLIYAVKN